MSSNSSSKKAPILEMLLFGGLAILLLSSLLRWNMASRESGQPLATTNSNPAVSTNNLAVQPNSSPAAIQPVTPQPVAATTGTHRVLCVSGDAGLNFRPQAGFSAPLFVVPCGAIVTVTGAPVNVQNETWLPVTYANRNGWSASKLLAPIR